ncbi:MAG: lytic transglycosylase domain-containing protein [Bacteroidales bacterium]|nr:lytic transglycosylase domain-containing protein [Bacteroidales bacterium]
MIKKHTILILLLALLLAIFVGVPAAGQGVYQNSHPLPPSVPSYVVFCGDTVRFDTAEKYERMDRELITFTYMHTTTTLMLKRSLRYFSQVTPIMKEMGIPDDFKYLMVIESNLDPKAVSVTGAAGLWQFTRATAQEFGLEVNSEVDERYHITKETEAACTFIKRAYARYGNWITAAASYNCGMGGMSRRIEEQGQKSFFDLMLPEETSRYVYRILAAKMLFDNPSAFGYDVYERYPWIKPQLTVTISEPIPSLVEFASRYGVSYAALLRANLWLRSDHLTNKARKTYRIEIPR